MKIKITFSNSENVLKNHFDSLIIIKFFATIIILKTIRNVTVGNTFVAVLSYIFVLITLRLYRNIDFDL